MDCQIGKDKAAKVDLIIDSSLLIDFTLAEQIRKHAENLGWKTFNAYGRKGNVTMVMNTRVEAERLINTGRIADIELKNPDLRDSLHLKKKYALIVRSAKTQFPVLWPGQVTATIENTDPNAPAAVVSFVVSELSKISPDGCIKWFSEADVMPAAVHIVPDSWDTAGLLTNLTFWNKVRDHFATAGVNVSGLMFTYARNSGVMMIKDPVTRAAEVGGDIQRKLTNIEKNQKMHYDAIQDLRVDSKGHGIKLNRIERSKSPS